MPVTILDGPVGTELLRRGIATPPPGWSSSAIRGAPEVLRAVHADYAAAGATVHTANTFRTRPAVWGEAWRALATDAVRLAREGAGVHGSVAGSIAPLADCYRPDLSPATPGPRHAEMARVLADAGCDLLLCETFPHVGEALSAVDAAVSTGLETWVSLTAGPAADLLTPDDMRAAAKEAIDRGAAAVLVNCVPASRTLDFVQALAGLGVPCGAYANAGHADEGMGWRPAPMAAARYADLADAWVAAGASIVGSCCGTGPDVIAELARRHRR
jgi:S-methylmethionine-dependent homocysteine/selenocysteine methylase